MATVTIEEINLVPNDQHGPERIPPAERPHDRYHGSDETDRFRRVILLKLTVCIEGSFKLCPIKTLNQEVKHGIL